MELLEVNSFLRPAISFDYKPGSGALHATSWFYTNIPGAEGWSEDDTGDGYHEQFKIWWSSWDMTADVAYNFEVEFWDPTPGLNTYGEINTSMYTIFSTGPAYRDHLSSYFLDKFCFASNDSIWRPPSGAC
jgi:hypothetical protein